MNLSIRKVVGLTVLVALLAFASIAVAQESSEGYSVVDSTGRTVEFTKVPERLVGLGPVHAQAQAAPQLLEQGLVGEREALAQLDEIAPRDRHLVAGPDRLALAAGVRGLEVRVVGQGRVAAHPEVVQIGRAHV